MRSERGAVLILVLWVLTMLTMVGGYYAMDAKIRRNLGQFAWDSVQGREALRSFILYISSASAKEEDRTTGLGRGGPAERGKPHVASGEIGGSAEKGMDWETSPLDPDGTVHAIDFGGQELRFTIQSEDGKLDLNMATEEQITDVLSGLISDQKEAKRITNAILDWRDQDNLERYPGSEEEAYLAMTPTYLPAQGPFRYMEDLLLVDGMTRDLYDGPIEYEDAAGSLWTGGLKDLFTVFNESGKVNAYYAPLPLFELLDLGTGTEDEPAPPMAGGTIRIAIQTVTRSYEAYVKMGGGGPDVSNILFWKETSAKRSDRTK